ncbi:HelD family protein [Streptomyces sp. NPDC101115]|uniref:HelD family protein n=1 Tax=Streptomyces sp. NPDC101115 TaxID=3366106 RepID=UPI0038108AD3
MAEDVEEQVVIGEDTAASGADAEVLGHHLRSRAKVFREMPPGPLFFGRLDREDGQVHHIGRRRIAEHPSAPPLVVDWRAPVSRAYYQAGPQDPQGVVRRRRFGWAPGSLGATEDLTALEDERLAGVRAVGEVPVVAPPAGASPAGAVPVGEAPVGEAPAGASPPGASPGGEGPPGDGSAGEVSADVGPADVGPAGVGSAGVGSAGVGSAGEGTGGPAAAEPGVSAILAGEIERPRVGPMRDIAATLQPEQDDLVRSGPADSLCVQGAPGTGKTAVGLHRAAYLLYTHPQRLQRSGLLVLGPNRTFLSYISEVLPALGETGVRQSTVAEEIARHEVRAEDDEAAARIKHDPRMAEVLRRVLYARVDPAPAEDLAVPDGSYRWRVPAHELAAIVAGVRAEAPPYAVGRERVRARIVRSLQLRAERRAGPQGAAWVRRIERARPVSAAVEACWPKVTPEEVLAAFLTDPDAFLADPDATGPDGTGSGATGPDMTGSGAPGSDGTRPDGELLTADERTAVRWARPPRSYRSARWSSADLVLLDELAGLIERPEGYGHLVVDEAQDLSPMECRAIARRADFGSLTVLGDLAQGTTPWAARDWREQLAHLGKPDAAVVPLTTGYRVPAAVVDLANRLLPELGAGVPAGRSLRAGGAVGVRRVADLVEGAADAVRAALAEEGSVGVIATDALAGRLREAGIEGLDGADGPGGADAFGGPGGFGGSDGSGGADGLPAGSHGSDGSHGLAGSHGSGGPGGSGGSGRRGGRAGRVSVVPASLAKGLEYDHVVVVEPAAIVAAEPRGLHRLYVVLTRAVSRLDLVHSEPLPTALRR